MSALEQEALSAIHELAGGQSAVVPFDELATHLDTTLSYVRTVVAVLQSQRLAVVTFGGVALTRQGLNCVEVRPEPA